MFNWKEFERVHSVIKLLRETSSSNAKASILNQYKDTPHLQSLLYYTYNKDLKYKITLKAISKAEVGNVKSEASSKGLSPDLMFPTSALLMAFNVILYFKSLLYV